MKRFPPNKAPGAPRLVIATALDGSVLGSGCPWHVGDPPGAPSVSHKTQSPSGGRGGRWVRLCLLLDLGCQGLGGPRVGVGVWVGVWRAGRWEQDSRP